MLCETLSNLLLHLQGQTSLLGLRSHSLLVPDCLKWVCRYLPLHSDIWLHCSSGESSPTSKSHPFSFCTWQSHTSPHEDWEEFHTNLISSPHYSFWKPSWHLAHFLILIPDCWHLLCYVDLWDPSKCFFLSLFLLSGVLTLIKFHKYMYTRVKTISRLIV